MTKTSTNVKTAKQTIRLELNARPHAGQRKIHAAPARFRVAVCGRRFGKTMLGVLECLDIANQGKRAWWVAPNYKMSEVGWRPLRNLGAQLQVEVRRADRQLVFPNGGEVTVRSADAPDSLRGEGLDFVVMDECAFIAEETWSEALRPALSDRQGRALFISTPRGRNWFWRLFQRGQGDDTEWQAWQMPTAANPYIPPSEIEAARQLLPELTFEQEYMAVFLESAGAVFRNIEAGMCAPDTTPEAHKEHRIVAGIDWGKQADFTALSIGCADCQTELARDRFNQIDYAFQRQRLMVLCAAWKPLGILAESNSMGEPIIEQLQRDGLPVKGFQTTAQSKPPLIENLALAFERGEWRWQADPVWTGELQAYERQVSPVTGRSAYSAPSGMHDDTVIARALMLWQAAHPPYAPLLPGELEQTFKHW